MTEAKEIREVSCTFGKVPVAIGDIFNWSGVYPGKYKVKRWGDIAGIYSPSGLGGTFSVWVGNESGEEIEWCADSVANGVFLTKNPNYFNPQPNE